MRSRTLTALVLFASLGLLLVLFGCASSGNGSSEDLTGEIYLPDVSQDETAEGEVALGEGNMDMEVEVEEEPEMTPEFVDKVADAVKEKIEKDVATTAQIEAKKVVDARMAQEASRVMETHKTREAEPMGSIKVLSGDGLLASAKRMNATLESMGYNVKRIDLAPSTRFPKPVVFYAKGFKESATSLANKVGQGMRVKPLTWHSIFDMIVVTANRH